MRRRQIVYGALSILVVFLTIFLLAQALLQQTRLEKTRNAYEEAIHLFLSGSDTLTNEVFAYADTGDARHMNEYWTEADVTKTRDIAVQILEDGELSADEAEALYTASGASNRLMELETHAMRLLADGAAMPIEEMPGEVAVYSLPAAERVLSAQAQTALAKSMLFGREYMTQKNMIIRNVSDFSYHLNSRIGLASTDNMRHAWLTITLSLVLFILFIILYQIASHKLEAYQREELRQREECFRIVASQTGHFVFRYDIPTRTFYLITGYNAPIDVPEVIPALADSAVLHNVVAKDSLAAYREFLRVLDSGETPPDTDVRLVEKGGEGKWYRFSASLVRDPSGKAISAVVSYAESDRQREQELAYSRWVQEMKELDQENVILHEWNISKDLLENEHGKMEPTGDRSSLRHFDERVQVYIRDAVYREDVAAYRAIMDREKLIGMFHSGVFSQSLDYREIQPDRSLRWMRLTLRLVMYPTSNDVKAYIMKQDIDDEKQVELALIQQSEMDSLTGAFNRRAFIEKVTELLHKAPKQNHVIMMLDIDGFKSVNDTFGHDFGDKLLQSFTEAARQELRPSDLIGRIGGDEFMICIPNVPTDSAIAKKAGQLINALHATASDGRDITVSMGVSVFSRDGASFEELYQKADIALYKIKKTGKNSFCFYIHGMESSGNTLTSFDG